MNSEVNQICFECALTFSLFFLLLFDCFLFILIVFSLEKTLFGWYTSRKSLSLSNHICLIAFHFFKKLPAPPKRQELEASQEVEILAITVISYI